MHTTFALYDDAPTDACSRSWIVNEFTNINIKIRFNGWLS